MKITETTPPVDRTFTLELTHNQLLLLGLVVGQSIPDVIKNVIDRKDWSTKPFPGVKYDPDFITDLYNLLKDS